MLIMVHQMNGPAGAVSINYIGESKGMPQSQVTLEKPCRILELMLQDGKLVRSWISDDLLTAGEMTFPISAGMGWRILDSETDQKIIDQYNKSVMQARAEKSGLLP